MLTLHYVKDSGIDTSTFKGHSTRSAATTSAARNKSVSVMNIMKFADWSKTQIPSPNFIISLFNLLSLATGFCPTDHMGVCVR